MGQKKAFHDDELSIEPQLKRPPSGKRSLLIAILLVLAIVFIIGVVVLAVVLPRRLSFDIDEPDFPAPPGPDETQSMALLAAAALGQTGFAKALYAESLEHGNIYQYGVGDVRGVVLGDFSDMEEAFVGTDSFDGRRTASIPMLAPLQPEGSTFLNTGEPWLQIRKFIGETILDEDYLHGYAQHRIDAAVQDLTRWVGAEGATAFNPEWRMRVFFSDVNHRIYFDQELEFGDDDDEAVVNDVFSMQKYTFEPNATMPRSAVERAQLPDYLKILNRFANYTQERTTEAIAGAAGSDETGTSSLVVMYNRFIEGLRAEGEQTWSDPTDGWRLSLDLFFAGHSSIPQITRWMLLYLAAKEDWQTRVRQEIDALGNASHIAYEDRIRLPLTVAFLAEVDRVRHHTPIGAPRYAMTDEVVGGYAIEEGVTMISNLWQVSHDPKIWGDPEVFRPERFLKSEGEPLADSGSNRIELDLAIVDRHRPFGVGLRSCPGEQIARRTIFRTMVTLIQSFDIRLPDDAAPNLDQTGDFAEPYDVTLIKRA